MLVNDCKAGLFSFFEMHNYSINYLLFAMHQHLTFFKILFPPGLEGPLQRSFSLQSQVLNF